MKIIRLRNGCRCYDCGAWLPDGSLARWYGGSRVTCLKGCQGQRKPRRVSTQVAHLARRLGLKVTRALMEDGFVRLTVEGAFPGPAQRLPGEVRRERPLLMPGGYSTTLTWIYVDPIVALQGADAR